MKQSTGLICLTAIALAMPAIAEETRELDAHEHGHGALNIAIEGDQLAIELEVPGFDIVGFEYEAESDADVAAIKTALDTLAEPLKLFGLPEGAGCVLTSFEAELHSDEDDHDEHDHEDEHDEEHAEGKDDDHDHDHGEEHDEAHDEEHDEEHGEEGHDDDHKDEHDHDHDEEHADEEAGETHSEFHGEYLFTCDSIDKVTSIDLTYFTVFPNAEELEVQVVSPSGAALLEATPEDAILDLTKAN